MNGADAIVRTLQAAGIDTCFANPGTSEMALVAALDRAPGIRCILGLFEGVVTGAADGYGRIAGRPAACLLHCGPGLANGLANLHNARRAGVPLINIVGDQATYHRAFLPPLATDVHATAAPYSHVVTEALSPYALGRDIAATIEAATVPPGQVATLIVPADIAWTEGAEVRSVRPPRAPIPVADETIARVVDILRSGEPVGLLLGGEAGLEAGIRLCGGIAKATGARLYAQMFNTRLARGRHLPELTFVPYNVDLAVETLAPLKHLILIGAPPPVAFFAYPGKPSALTPPSCEITVLADAAEDQIAALAAVAEAVGAAPWLPQTSADGAPEPARGQISCEGIARSVAALLPENSIVVDESLTSGGPPLRAATARAAAHDWLQLTGGAIGIGIPLATGAAVAAPGRRVVNLQADGSGMYTMQALWTQARENLDVTTVIYSNRAYAILRQELAALGVDEPGKSATDMMDLGRPDLDWVSLAKGMGVEGVRATTAEAFNDAFSAANSRRGPFLIEAAV